MAQSTFQTDKRRLVAAVALLLTVGFVATALTNYFISRAAIGESIVASALPLTSDNLYSEIQKDLLRPILISSLMSANTFLHDWVHSGEKDIGSITRHLREIRDRYGAVTSFFISERTRYYYQAGGILKQVSTDDARDAWYFRVRQMSAPYELNLDPDAYVDLAISALITGIVLLLTTLTISRHQRHLEEMATTDKLTGLANRQAFSVLIPQAVRESARSATPLVAIMMDIDHFKSVNDRYGHSAGDTVLARIGGVIRESLRGSDYVFRWGGEEFLVIVKGQLEDEGRALAEKIRRAVGETRIEHESNALSVTISAGVAALRKDESIEVWIDRADGALYDAKQDGRNAVRVSSGVIPARGGDPGVIETGSGFPPSRE